MQTRPKLVKGDSIALCATARFVEQNVIDQATSFLEEAGYAAVLATNLHIRHHQMSGSDKERANALQDLFDDRNIKAIWCLRGGFGGLRILDLLDFSALCNFPKLLIGFSDFTSVLNHACNLELHAIHGPMPIQLEKLSQEAKNSLLALFCGEEINYSWPSSEYNQIGEVKGKIVGGNLSVLYSLIGSRSFPKLDGNILFLEDLDEYIYHIDRMLLAFKRSGHLIGIKGLLVGSFSDLHDHDIPFGQNYQEIILEHFKEFNIPIAFNFPAGHQDDNRVLPFGFPAQLNVQQTQNSSLH